VVLATTGAAALDTADAPALAAVARAVAATGDLTVFGRGFAAEAAE
jgi:hypothetical protein